MILFEMRHKRFLFFENLYERARIQSTANVDGDDNDEQIGEFHSNENRE